MNFILHKHQSKNHIVTEPNGLRELMSDISREVLREQPKNINLFIADYLDAMIITREHAIIAEKTTDQIYDIGMTICDLLANTITSLSKARKVVEIVQYIFRVSLQRIKCNESNFIDGIDTMANQHGEIIENELLTHLFKNFEFTEDEAKHVKRIIRLSFKRFYYREKEYSLKIARFPDYDWVDRTEMTLSIYRKSTPAKWELDRAAVIIQSAYRGYCARKMPKLLQSYNENALKIQKRFRGFKARQDLCRAKNAALELQSQFRGYQMRKKLIDQNQAIRNIQRRRLSKKAHNKCHCEVISNHKRMDDNTAATKIQSNFRGYKARKSLNVKLDLALKIQSVMRRSALKN